MEKKSRKTEINDDLNFDDLEDLDIADLDFSDEGGLDDSREPRSTSSVSKELAEEAGKGFLDGLITNTAKKSLNSEYSDNFYELTDYAQFAKDTFASNASVVKKSVYRLGKEVKKIIPFQFKMLDNFLEKYETDFEQYKQESEEAMRESSIQSNISGIFDKQLEVQKAIEAKRDAEKQVENKERITTNKLNIDILSSIDSNIANHSAFTLQITKEYYKKTLELQFKSYYIQADMLKTMRDYYKGFSIQFDNIQKNTGLPEFVKLNQTERIQDIIRTQMVQNTYKNLFSNSKYIEGVKNKASKFISDKVSNVTDKVDTVTDQLGMINSATEGTGGSALGLLSGALSGMFGNTLGEKLADKISPKIKDRIKDNKYINAGANYAGALGSSPSTLFSFLKSKTAKKASEYEDESNPLRYLASKTFGGLNELLGVTDPTKEEFKVTTASSLNHNKPAIFDNKVHRSITEVIPMYLAKILKENSELRFLYSKVNEAKVSKIEEKDIPKELTYDYEGRTLDTHDNLIKSVENNILKSNSAKNKVKSTTNQMLSSSLSELKKDKEGNKDYINLLSSKKTEKLLEEYLSKASNLKGVKYDYDRIIANPMTPSSPASLKALLSDNPELQKILIALRTVNKKDRVNITDRMKDTKRDYPIVAVKELVRNSSKLAGNKLFAKIKDDEAEILSKNFSKLILKGTEISIDLIKTGGILKSFTKKDYELVKKIMTVLISNVKRIADSGDIQNESSLLVLLGAVNRSLKDNFELDPEIFQTLFELNPILGKKGVLTEENLIGRKLFNNADEEELVTAEEIRKVTRANKKQVTDIHTEIIETEFISNLNTGITEAKKDFKEAGMNPFKLVKTIIKHTKAAVSGVRKIAEEKYEEASKKLKGLEGPMNDFIKNTTAKGHKKLVDSLDSSLVSIDNMIKAEEASRDEQIKNLEEAKAKLSEITEETNMREIDKEIKLLNLRFKSSIKALEQLKATLKTQRDSVAAIKPEELSTVTETMSKLKQQLTSTLEKVKQIRDSLKEEQELVPA